MLKLRRILVPVNDLKRRVHSAALKAAQLARASGGEIELFHAYDQMVDVFGVPDAIDPDKFEQSEHRKILRRLEALAERLRRLGVRVNVAVTSDYPAHDAIIRRAMQSRSDLIVVDAHRHHRAPALLRVTDWELLRHSPIPVLLVKNARRYQQPQILAAVDPRHSFSKPTGLDGAILEAGEALQAALKGKLDAVHGYIPMPAAALAPEMVMTADAYDQLRHLAQHEAETGMNRLLRSSKIPRSRRHVVAENPMAAIPRLSRQLHNDIMIMGAVSRSGLKRIFIGNTAERVLDELPCDVLVVKPKAFDARVPRQPRGIHWAMLGAMAPL